MTKDILFSAFFAFLILILCRMTEKTDTLMCVLLVVTGVINILFRNNASYALIFLIFTLVLQTVDGYVLKPRLFGNSLGVSGLWILIGIVVGGNMFGVGGILLAIPAVAIIDFMYGNYLLPKLEKRRREG